ncbi:uncharacterized protein BDR25DRAFT_360417 [Lindgomyces ingoldianus]|uniref:Uncharacterized protein n=1 Tax=Lindgomyces ingoldianus TaxID=673940 RepID=A0ACB6QG29_9PLEO|nr:uncharacterized protein BDR25DRAFT_360417 [Lindgomyces ingoldianus]KAF2465460.1 hypothetical protein BDR25DRAFT_360417 [Lindgomyces ingoldianus]
MKQFSPYTISCTKKYALDQIQIRNAKPSKRSSPTTAVRVSPPPPLFCLLQTPTKRKQWRVFQQLGRMFTGSQFPKPKSGERR